MALYLGNEKIQITLTDKVYQLCFPGWLPIVFTNVLWSSDGYVLKDSNGIYLIPKDGE